MNGTKMGGHL